MGREKEPLRTPAVKRKPRSLVRKEVGVIGLEVFFGHEPDQPIDLSNDALITYRNGRSDEDVGGWRIIPESSTIEKRPSDRAFRLEDTGIDFPFLEKDAQ